MTIVNLLVFWKYKHCKFDRPYVFVVLAYNLGYLLDAFLATLSLMDYKPESVEKNLAKAFLRLVSSISDAAVFASLFLFAAALHRVKHILSSENH